jgi:ribonucleoside-triphosphate reductase
MSTPINTSDNTVECKIPCEVFSRIVGYIRPLQNWHQGKQQEFKDRKTFAVPADAGSEE